MPYVPHTASDRAAMLKTIGVESVSDLFREIPQSLRISPEQLDLPDSHSEYEIERHLTALSKKNHSANDLISFLGAGMYDRFIPASVGAIISRGEFLTAYTPYQPEASQGSLQTIYEFQSMIAEIFGTDLANASMYDGATSLAEAAVLAHGVNHRNKIAVSEGIHPHHRQVIDTYCWALGLETILLPLRNGLTVYPEDSADLACILVGYPNFLGCIENLRNARECCDAGKSMLIVSADPVACALLKPPGAYGADIVVGEGQSLGVAMGLGGPAVGLFGCKEEFVRRLPGRIVGMTKEVHGEKTGFVMTLRTREQDIRREKATSNICTNEALMALANTVYLCAVGKNGLKQVAEVSVRNARYLQSQLELAGFRRSETSNFFCEFAVDIGTDADPVVEKMVEMGFLAGVPLGKYMSGRKNQLLVATTEKRDKIEIDSFVVALKKAVAN